MKMVAKIVHIIYKDLATHFNIHVVHIMSHTCPYYKNYPPTPQSTTYIHTWPILMFRTHNSLIIQKYYKI